MGFRRPSAPSTPASRMEQYAPAAATRKKRRKNIEPFKPSVATVTEYNPMRTPFSAFQMSPYLLSAPRTAGRPSLVRSRG